MRERCFEPSRYQCMRYVVSYPRLSRMTLRKGTTGPAYLRFWARDEPADFLPRTAAAREGAVFFAAVFLARTGAAGAARRAGRAAVVRAAGAVRAGVRAAVRADSARCGAAAGRGLRGAA